MREGYPTVKKKEKEIKSTKKKKTPALSLPALIPSEPNRGDNRPLCFIETSKKIKEEKKVKERNFTRVPSIPRHWHNKRENEKDKRGEILF